MKQIQITINKANVYDEVAKTTSYAGAKMPEDAAAYDRIFTTDEDRLMLERFWAEACGGSTEQMKKFVSSVNEHSETQGVELGRNYEVVLSVCDRYADSMTDSVKSSLFSYFVSYIVSRWFRFTNKGESETYGNDAAGAMDDVMRKLNYKSRPVRIPPQAHSGFTLTKIEDYLFQADYDSIDYDYAREYFLTKNPEAIPTACSSVRAGNWYGRNLDWHYDHNAEFAVRTPTYDGRRAVIGVSGGLNGLTNAFVESGAASDLYKILPFYLQDGINEDGVFCNTNVVPTDKGITTLTTPQIKERSRICTLMIPRYVLDNFSTAEEAVEYLKNYASLYTPKALLAMGYETHFMIGDANKTYVVEIVDNVVVAHEHGIMTNFFIDGVTFNEDGTVYTQYDIEDGHLPTRDSGITPYGSGLERYNTIVSALNAWGSEVTEQRMTNLMHNLFFTNAYKPSHTPWWYSEFVTDKYGITVDTPIDSEVLRDIVHKYFDIFTHRSRDAADTWQTTHMSIYDIEGRTLHLRVQEGSTKHTITLMQ